MNSVQIEQETYEMPPREGISIAFFPDVGGATTIARTIRAHRGS